MTRLSSSVPVVLFTYSRSAHLARVLECLRENRVPQLEVFCDGAKNATDAAGVAEARALVRQIDWCEVRITERPLNLGLGRNVLSGVTEIAERYEAFVVWEDDLIAVPGTYAWVCAALRAYADIPRVMSITGWTHPRVTPADVGSSPYFDGRAECWVWAGWARSWAGMLAQNALGKLAAAAAQGVKAEGYGGDLPVMARQEEAKNIWAVRWLYHHLQHGGLCVRPPWSMVEHLGVDASATNAAGSTEWTNPPLGAAPPIPTEWPAAIEHPDCRSLWRRAYPSKWRSRWRRLFSRLKIG